MVRMTSACGIGCGRMACRPFCGGCPGGCAVLGVCRRPGFCTNPCADPCGASARAWAEVAGMGLGMPTAGLACPRMKLPAYMPTMIDNRRVGTAACEDWRGVPIVAIKAKDLLSGRPGHRRVKSPQEARERFGVPEGVRLAAHFYDRDHRLEEVWTRRAAMLPALRGYDLVFAPNFSVYEDAPRLSHLLAMRRNVWVLDALLDLGVPCVPDVAWGGRRDLERWAAWLGARDVGLAAYSFLGVGMGVRSGRAPLVNLVGLQWLAAAVPATRWVVVGPAAASSVANASAAAGGEVVCVLNSEARLKAAHGRLWDGGRWRRVPGPERSNAFRRALFLENVRRLAGAYSASLGLAG